MECGTRSIVTTSIPPYFSVVRRINKLYVGRPLPSLPFVGVDVRVNGKREEQHYPKETLRYDIDASVAQRIWSIRMQTATMCVLPESASCDFSFSRTVYVIAQECPWKLARSVQPEVMSLVRCIPRSVGRKETNH